MPLLCFEGVQVDVPTTLTGVQFSFTNGVLSIECHEFSGNIVLSKPSAPPMTLSDFPSLPSAVSTSTSTDVSSKKRTVMEDVDFSTDSDSDAHHKRLRATASSDQDAERSLLLTQLESSQQSAQSSSMEVESLLVSSTSPENNVPAPPAAVAATVSKTPAKASKTRKSPQKRGTPQQKNFFSPETKEHASRKTPETSASKRNHSGKNKSEVPATQASIRDMMLQPRSPPKPKISPQPLHATWSTIEAEGPAPVGRWGHTATRISDNRVVVYGGTDDAEATLGDLHVFDLKKHSWSQPLNCESAPRTWHDAVHLEDKHLLLVFGGERTTNDDELEILSDIMVLDTECFLWYPPAISGISPTARSGHTCTVIGNDIVVFGGSRGRTRPSAVSVLDSDTWNWKNVKIEGKAPNACTYHTAVAVGDSIVYFGGNDTKESFNSVDVLQRNGGGGKWTWFHPCVVGIPPCGRTGHSATLLDATRILIFGGWDPQTERPASTTVMNDAFVLNTETWEWEEMRIETNDADEKLPGRVGHCAVLTDDKTLLLFGGQNMQEQRLQKIEGVSISGIDKGAEAAS